MCFNEKEKNMKRMQQGFTLIELMIVVVIVGLLAAFAIPAYQDYIVKAKLTKVMSAMDPVKTALASYFEEQGGFPIAQAGDLVGSGGLTPGMETTLGTFWDSLGFSVYPSLPHEVATMAVHDVANGGSGTTASNIALILRLQNIKAGTIDGVLVAVSPNTMGNAPFGPTTTVTPRSATTSTLTPTESVAGASALHWYYGCDKGTATSTDGVLKAFFKNGTVPMVCQ